MSNASQKGVTLIELMIVVAILVIIATVGFPAYTGYVQKSRRAEAKAVLQDLALRQERWRASDTNYGTLAELITLTPAMADPSDTYYTYTVANAQFTYTLTATPQGGQASDAASGTSCNPLTLDQTGTQAPAACW